MRQYTWNKQTGQVSLATDFLEWAMWFEKNDNRSFLNTTVGDDDISTVFTGIDHGYSTIGKEGHIPTLWETMVFGGPMDGAQHRYKSQAEAEAGHWEMVAEVTKAQQGNP